MKVVRSSPLRTGRLYPQEYPGTHFDMYMSYGWGISQGRVTYTKLNVIIMNHVTM